MRRSSSLPRTRTIPVINGLTARSHPCQIMADMLTFEERKGPIKGPHRRLARRCQQRRDILGACRGPFRLHLAHGDAAGVRAAPDLLTWARARAPRIEVSDGSHKPPRPAPIAWSPTPGSPWATKMSRQRRAALEPFRVDEPLMARAKPDAIFMHCLPAHRGDEVTDAVIDGPQSVVWDEAENRLHVQKAILAWCLQTDASR